MLEFVCHRLLGLPVLGLSEIRSHARERPRSSEGVRHNRGHAPSFIVQWRAEPVVSDPVVGTLMLDGGGTQGISLVGGTWVIDEADP
jgi:hypothetical protein